MKSIFALGFAATALVAQASAGPLAPDAAGFCYASVDTMHALINKLNEKLADCSCHGEPVEASSALLELAGVIKGVLKENYNCEKVDDTKGNTEELVKVIDNKMQDSTTKIDRGSLNGLKGELHKQLVLNITIKGGRDQVTTKRAELADTTPEPPTEEPTTEEPTTEEPTTEEPTTEEPTTEEPTTEEPTTEEPTTEEPTTEEPTTEEPTTEEPTTEEPTTEEPTSEEPVTDAPAGPVVPQRSITLHFDKTLHFLFELNKKTGKKVRIEPENPIPKLCDECEMVNDKLERISNVEEVLRQMKAEKEAQQ